MKIMIGLPLVFALAAFGLVGLAAGLDRPAPDASIGFSTVVKTPLSIEGLTADDAGRLYTAGRAGVNGAACTVWRIDPDAAQCI